MTHLQISVIVPVYNGAPYLAETIESALAQTLPALEIIVIDDGSTDPSSEIASQFAQRSNLVRVLRRENGGISAARNYGIANARGNAFALLDADDIWLPQKLEKQAAALQNENAAAYVFGYAQEFISPELPPEIRATLSCEPEPRPGMLPSAMLVTRDAFHRVGEFSPHWHAGEFADWVLRANEAGLQKIMLPDVILRRRVHAANNGIQNRAKMTDYARIIKQSLDRRRAAGKD